jgi:hypothetical protein
MVFSFMLYVLELVDSPIRTNKYKINTALAGKPNRIDKIK